MIVGVEVLVCYVQVPIRSQDIVHPLKLQIGKLSWELSCQAAHGVYPA